MIAATPISERNPTGRGESYGRVFENGRVPDDRFCGRLCLVRHAMITTPKLTKAELDNACERALQICDDINCPVAVVDALWSVNLSVSEIGGRALGDAIEAERRRRAEQRQTEEV